MTSLSDDNQADIIGDYRMPCIIVKCNSYLFI